MEPKNINRYRRVSKTKMTSLCLENHVATAFREKRRNMYVLDNDAPSTCVFVVFGLLLPSRCVFYSAIYAHGVYSHLE
ncbi:hypothetical protein DPMN_124686 [Dreissena polymorpha]|uniref:Uncharacterized protein n=1 Tax=Dreissena polymorpha TaxID=45954 RepID=A0A9D4JWF3_DREPO|nr:hypothetical protein DPMN_124686 [Dreissena polymorpha]